MLSTAAQARAPLIRSRHIAVGFLGLYVLAAAAYGLTLELTTNWSYTRPVLHMSIDYGIKGVLSLGLAYLAFRVLAGQTTRVRVAVIALLALPFAFAWQWLYYMTCDALGVGHLGSVGKW